MSEPPQIRLVTRSQYAFLISRWLLCFELAILCLGLGGGLLLIELYYVSVQFAIFCHAPIEIEQTPFGGPLAFLIVPLGCVLALAGRKLFAHTGKALPFTPITSENIHLLPTVESLLRPSALPLQSQQAELLRPMPESQDTPPNQLLRATQSSPENDLPH